MINYATILISYLLSVAITANHPSTTATTTKVEFIGHSRTAILTLQNVLPPSTYTAFRDNLRSRTDFFEGHANNVGFPGKIGIIDKTMLNPLVAALLASKKVLQHFPKEIFEQREHVRGFASVLCHEGWIHNDYMGSELDGVVSPAAVFYFTFDESSSTPTTGIRERTGTAFYREIATGVERVTSVLKRREELAPAATSTDDGANEVILLSPNGESFNFQEIHRYVATPNSLILYPQDLLHNSWTSKDDNDALPCSMKKGRLAISLFFLSQHQGKEIVDVLGNVWRTEATQMLCGGKYCFQKAHYYRHGNN